MIPTKAQILDLLEETRAENPERNYGWVTHSLGVGDTAGVIAQALNEAKRQDYHYDIEEVVKLGYLHDIGKKVGEFHAHVLNGYNYMKELGFDEKYCNISLTHSFVNHDAFCTFSEFVQPDRDKFVIDFIAEHQFTPEEWLISFCDIMVLLDVMTVDKRIVDIISRHGAWQHTQQRVQEAYKLKAHFDELLGYNLYDLFPRIKENL